MAFRFASLLAILVMLLVGSGAALALHEQTAHPVVAPQTMADLHEVDAGHSHPAHPAHSQTRHPCDVCDQLLHLAAVVGALLFVFGFVAAAKRFIAPMFARPAIAELATPRSARGPPLAA